MWNYEGWYAVGMGDVIYAFVGWCQYTHTQNKKTQQTNKKTCIHTCKHTHVHTYKIKKHNKPTKKHAYTNTYMRTPTHTHTSDILQHHTHTTQKKHKTYHNTITCIHAHTNNVDRVVLEVDTQ